MRFSSAGRDYSAGVVIDTVKRISVAPRQRLSDCCAVLGKKAEKNFAIAVSLRRRRRNPHSQTYLDHFSKNLFSAALPAIAACATCWE